MKIKKKQIIIELFGYITYLMIEKNISDPQKVLISLVDFEKYFNDKVGSNLSSIQHIYQQIRSYERLHFLKIFRREMIQKENDIIISLADSEKYQDKLYLHIGLKLAIANGVSDLIEHLYENEKEKRPLNIYLSAGAECYYLADVLFNKKSTNRLNIYTHNLGIIDNYVRHYSHIPHISLYSRFGKIHLKSFIMLENMNDHYANTSFDAIVGATAYIDPDKYGLYIEDETESRYKKEIYKLLKGPRILMLTMFEFVGIFKACKCAYSNINDFDYIVVPSEKFLLHSRSKIDKLSSFSSMIKYYTYEVLEKRK